MVAADELAQIGNFKRNVSSLNKDTRTLSNFSPIYLIIRLIPSSVRSLDMLAYDATSMRFIFVTGTSPVAPMAL